MESIKSFFRLPAILAALFFVLAGCASTGHREHPRLEDRMQGVETFGFLVPEVDVREISAGGVMEARSDWCETGRSNIVVAVSDVLKEKGVGFKMIDLSVAEEMRQEIEELKALYRAVSYSIRLHTYGSHVFPEKVRNFEYSLGPVRHVLDRFQCDAVLFVYGADAVSTSGRKALMALGTVVGVLSGVIVVPRGGTATINIAVVGPAGDILWYCSSSDGGMNLTDPANAKGMVEKMLVDFPGGAP